MIFLRRLFSRVRKEDIQNIAGLVIDMQDYYIHDHTRSKKFSIIENQLNMLDYLIAMNYPVAVLEFMGKGKGPTIQILQDKLFTATHEYFPKEDNDGFTNPDLLKKLNEWGSKHLILMGVNSSFCVK